MVENRTSLIVVSPSLNHNLFSFACQARNHQFHLASKVRERIYMGELGRWALSAMQNVECTLYGKVMWEVSLEYLRVILVRNLWVSSWWHLPFRVEGMEPLER